MSDRVLVAGMIAWIEQNLLEPITTNDLVRKSGYSQNRLRQKFYTVTGDTPSGYLRKRRLTEASKEILAGQRIVDVALRWGYSSQENFTTAFRSYFGVTPYELSLLDGKYRRFVRRLREAYTIMELADLTQPSISTTRMGCIKGAADYFDLDLSTPMLFGLSGHAFLVNMHEQMCPSSPYAWDHRRFFELLGEQGITLVDTCVVTRETDGDERAAIERMLRSHLDGGDLAILDFMECQLLTGYDEEGFTFALPWNGKAQSELRRLSAGTWKECLEPEGWVHFDVIARAEPSAPLRDTVRRSLDYAVELFEHGERYAPPGYRIGRAAWELWIDLVREGKGATHAHWWNAKVWSECRANAGAYLGEVDEITGGEAHTLCVELAGSYARISDRLERTADQKLPAQEQESLIADSLEDEAHAVAGIEELAGMLAG